MHEGKKDLIVDAILTKGDRTHNNWASVIESFCEQIDLNTVEGTVDILDPKFSTLTLTDSIATKVTIMDICKSYFRYIIATECGFPRITLDGEKKDWTLLYKNAEKLLNEKVDEEFGEKWGEALLPVLKRFENVYDGEIDCLFWNSMIKIGSSMGNGSSDVWYSGWINVFFPICNERFNYYCVPYKTSNDYVKNGLKKAGRGPDIEDFPKGIASAPVIWDCYQLKFVAGFMGITQDEETKEVSPLVGWAIGEKK